MFNKLERISRQLARAHALGDSAAALILDGRRHTEMVRVLAEVVVEERATVKAVRRTI